MSEKLLPPKSDNPAGFWEHQDILQIHEKLLQELNSSWDDVRSLPDGWWNFETTQRYTLDILNILKRDFADSSFWGVKDPRICRFLPIWLPLLEQTGSKTYFLIIVRNPLEVVDSLAERNGFSKGQSCLLWLKHLIEAEKGTRNSLRVFITYEELLSDWKKLLSRIQTSFGFRWPVTLKKAGPEIEAFLKNRLRHNRITDEALIEDEGLAKWIKDAYFAVTNTAREGDRRLIKTLRAIEAGLKEAAALYEPALADIWEKNRANHAMLQERSQHLDEISNRLKEFEQDRAKYLAGMNHLQAGLKDRDERIQQVNTEVAELRDQLSMDRQVVVEREAEITHLQTGIKKRDDRLQQLDAELTDIRGELAVSREAISARDARFAGLQAEVKERDRRIEQLDTAVGALQAELAASQENVRARTNETSQWISVNVRRFKCKIITALYLFRKQHRMIKKSGLFDSAYYLKKNPDVANSGINPVIHYLAFGAKERRNPNPLFDTAYYFQQNPDVAESGMNPLVHYIRYSRRNGRESGFTSQHLPTAQRDDGCGFYESLEIKFATLKVLQFYHPVTVVVPCYVHNKATLNLLSALADSLNTAYPHARTNLTFIFIDDASPFSDVRTLYRRNAFFNRQDVQVRFNKKISDSFKPSISV
ncbi:MAG: sulfotransferase family protein [Planctomycetota bacterium]